MEAIVIRRAEQGDLPALLAIYNHYVRETPATFDIEPRTPGAAPGLAGQFRRDRPLSVLCGGEGWRAGGLGQLRIRYNDRAAYDTTVASSIYLAPDARGQGLGRRLYAALFEALAREDIHRVFAGITLPNEASVGLHRSFGFRAGGDLTGKWAANSAASGMWRPISSPSEASRNARPSHPPKPLL